MNYHSLKPYLLGMLAVTTLATACKKTDDDDDDDDAESKTVNYVMSLRALDGADESADYYLTMDDIMTGEISAEGQGVELVGWNYAGHFGDTYFAFGYDLNECVAYTLNDAGYLVEKGKFVFERFDVMREIDDNSFMAIGAPWGGGSYDCQLQVVDIADVSISKNVKHPIYVSFDDTLQMNAWPTNSYVDGDKFYVSFYPLNGETWETPNTDTAYISVYTYPGLEYVETFKDARTGPIGYYGDQPSIITTENGDHYTFSSGAKSAGFTQATKPSAILRVKAGESAFDQSYLFDVESTGYKVTTAVYVGNNIVVANVVANATDETAAAANTWALFDETDAILNTAVVDLSAQTLTIVDDVPLHGGQYKTPFLVEGTDVYISVNTGTEAYVYKVDSETATATKGAKLIGNQFQGLFKGNS